MTLAELRGLAHGSQVILRDGREAILLEVHEHSVKNNVACIHVDVLNDDGIYSHNEWMWPAQVTF